MPTSWDSVNVQCPFYRQSSSRHLSCEGVWSASTIDTTFHSTRSRQELMERLCMSAYTQCPLYRQIEKKYEE